MLSKIEMEHKRKKKLNALNCMDICGKNNFKQNQNQLSENLMLLIVLCLNNLYLPARILILACNSLINSLFDCL